ncbi:hypothetical protein BJ878DRAFT_420735 [Calycina marina]|uniref:DUF3824 domain-containing protein n=1 Tax=Calycina marina TaxID=1763456 RepID=A0A9P8CF37_9HELO|nr:hypothetical protein BJ878DRAFT_420735 [Calycina marina]
MPEVSKVSRNVYYRDRDDYSSDDDRSNSERSRAGGSSYRTVQRYRVTPSRDDEDRHSSRLGLPRAERIEVDRRIERYAADLDRPRSAIDVRPRTTVAERYVERDSHREPEREQRTRTLAYERDREQPRERETEFSRTWEENRRPWESERDVRETETRIEKRETETRVEKRTERREPREQPYEVERYQRETEYYECPEPTLPPIIIRQQAREPQQIIVQEAPAPQPVVIPAPVEQSYEVVRREVKEVKEEVKERSPSPRREEKQDDEYYYRRDVRDVGPLREEREVVAYRDDRRHKVDYYRDDRRDDRRYYDDRDRDRRYSDEDVVVRRKVVQERSRSSSPQHRRHLAEGALAGAGAAALLANHRGKQGNAPEHRGRNVVGGAALGAIGTELITRARSRYREHNEGGGRSRSRSRSRHPAVKTALGLAVAGIAAAAAVKYAKDRKANTEELTRGRSRTRSRSVSRRRRYSSDGSFSEEREAVTKNKGIKHDAKHQAASIAKAGAATAAMAGVVEHFRNKSKQRNGDRSKSRIRTGAEIAGAGLAGAAVAGLYENRKAAEDAEVEEKRIRKERRKQKNRARERSIGESYVDPDVDPKLGMVQYGTDPVYTHQTTTNHRGYEPYDVATPGAAAAYGATRSRSRRRQDDSSSDDDRQRSQSRSRMKDIAGAGYEEEAQPENYYADEYRDNYTPSPPHASGGSFYPENNQFPPPPISPSMYQQPGPEYQAGSTIPPYNPANCAAPPQNPHDPYGYPPGHNVSRDIPYSNSSNTNGNMPYFHPPPMAPPEYKSVKFGPLLPKSSHSLSQVHPDKKKPSHSRTFDYEPADDNVYDDPSSPPPPPRQRHKHRQRRESSDPSSDRPRRRRKRDPSPVGSEDVEVLPDRFDHHGRPIARIEQGPGGQQEMVEKLTGNLEDVLGGRKTWRDLLGEVVGEVRGRR